MVRRVAILAFLTRRHRPIVGAVAAMPVEISAPTSGEHRGVYIRGKHLDLVSVWRDLVVADARVLAVGQGSRPIVNANPDQPTGKWAAS